MAETFEGSAMRDSVFVYSPSYQTYQFHQEHPFNQRRVLLTYDLLQAADAFDEGDIVTPRTAAKEELALVHTEDYIQAVELAGAPAPCRRRRKLRSRNGRHPRFCRHA